MDPRGRRRCTWGKALTLLGAQLVANGGARAETVREVLLKEARQRLTAWYSDEASLQRAYWSGNANVRLSKDTYWCDAKGGTGRMPLTFGEFNVSGASPRDVFSALTDVAHTLDWDHSLSDVAPLGQFQEEGVVGMNILLASGIVFVPPRELFEWVAFNESVKDQEFWLAYTSLENEQLHAKRPRDEGAVAMQNCFGAYWVRPCPAGGEKHWNCPSSSPYDCCPDGGSSVIFTQHVNLHAPSFLPPQPMFDASWFRQIDWANTLRDRARALHKSGEARIAIPDWALQPANPSRPTSPASPPALPSTPGLPGLASPTQPPASAASGSLGASIAKSFPPTPGTPAATRFYELPGDAAPVGLHSPWLPWGVALACLLASAALAAFALARPLPIRRFSAAVLQRARRRGGGSFRELPAEEAAEELPQASSWESLLHV